MRLPVLRGGKAMKLRKKLIAVPAIALAAGIAVAEELSRQFAAGTLDQEVFDTRMAAALGATQQYELDILTMDLPVLD
jgi:Domain of unknown function (DUF1707)